MPSQGAHHQISVSTETARHLQMGLAVMIQKKVENGTVRATSTIVGRREPDILIVETPRCENGPLLDGSEQYCAVRLVSEGSVIGFRAEVLGRVEKPFDLLFLRFPQNHQEVNVRRLSRIACNIEAKVLPGVTETQETNAEGEEPPDKERAMLSQALNATLVDISGGGCQALLPIYRPEDSAEEPSPLHRRIRRNSEDLYMIDSLKAHFTNEMDVELTFEVPAPVERLYNNVIGRIRWVRSCRSFYLMGLQFVRYPPELPNELSNLVRHQRRYFEPPVDLP